MTRKVIVHPSPFDAKDAWDVFSNDPNDTAESLGLYDAPSCTYVIAYKEEHPELHYIGSEDNNHIWFNSPPEEKE